MNDWPTVRARIIQAFDGEQPGATLEQQIVDLYENNPAAVIDSIDAIATSKKAGRVQSGWGVLRKAAAERATRKTNPTVSKEKAVRRAEQWIRNAGCYIQSEQELVDALFGTTGNTPPLEYLLSINELTRGNPGRHMYGPLLQQAITITDTHGPEPVPATEPGILADHRTVKLRDRMVQLWRETREHAIAAELDHINRLANHGQPRRTLKEAA